jgi:HK97 family phage prohead protease/HK97 family phage major capsid protein
MSTATATDVREQRTYRADLRLEERRDGELRLSGLAAVFESESLDLGGFVERIKPGAFADALRSRDQVLLWSHDESRPLARCPDTLKLWEAADGLRFEATLPATTLARDAVELVRSGVVNGASFAFSMRGGKDEWETRADGTKLRTIHKVGSLHEVSICTWPAYPATAVDARAAKRAALKAHVAAAVAELEGKTPSMRGRVPRRQPGPYDDGQHSYFADLIRVSLAERVLREAQDAGSRATRLPDVIIGRTERGELDSVEAAQERLRRLVEQRDVTTGDPGAGAFVPSGLSPSLVSDAFAVAARAAARIAPLLPQEPLPPGMTVSVPRFEAGAVVASQNAELATVPTQDVDTAAQTGPVGTLAGRVIVTEQALRSTGGRTFDLYLASELGRAYAAELDRQLVEGTGSNGELRGMANWPGIVSRTWNDSTPTGPELVKELWALSKQAAAAYGDELSVLVLHPRRRAWLESEYASLASPRLPGRQTVLSAAVPLAGSPLADKAYLLEPAACLLGYREPVFRVYSDWSGSGTLTVQVLVVGFAALVVKQPSGVAVLDGNGLQADLA